MIRLLLYMCFISCIGGCSKGDAVIAADPFRAEPSAVTIDPGNMDEASGIADSKVNPGHLWVQEDSGNPNQLFLLSYTGELRKRIRLKGIENRDWEDIAIANGPVSGRNYLYVADIGNNHLSLTKFYIYRFPEPPAAADVVDDFEKISFRYPGGQKHDAEALLVDNRSKDIYIITKRDTFSLIYRIPYPQSTSSTIEAELLGQLPFNGVVSAAFSPGRDEVLMKTYSTVYYWKIGTTGSIEQVLNAQPVKLPYKAEPQGEAICFRNDNTGFFTLSERPAFIHDVKLYFYLRN